MVVFIDHSLEDASPSKPAIGSFESGNIPPPSFTKDSQFMLAASLPQLRAGDSTRTEIVDKTGPERDMDPSSLNGIISMALSCYPLAQGHLMSNGVVGLLPGTAVLLGGNLDVAPEIWLTNASVATNMFVGAEDVTYQRVWSWRTRYNEFLGGGGHWVGYGDCGQGVQCGLEQRCLAAEYIEVEVDCEVGDRVSEFSRSDSSNDSSLEHLRHSSSFSHSDGRDDEEPGYLRQEIEGIGGVVKQKVKKRVRVGASVEERDDDRENATYLKQETSGAVRSRCGWCSGIVPSNVERNRD
ncbi:hypothetical protein A7C99_5540 [Trichophyton rubrum]|uniref:Uncharacterized protein n=1 Tax=Trichophyton rubrum TaxID=5551 RepID=A0A178ESW6_TRIRU|nr:hypothetical protein A7C99_5540 [Trichophyton rubrum]